MSTFFFSSVIVVEMRFVRKASLIFELAKKKSCMQPGLKRWCLVLPLNGFVQLTLCAPRLWNIITDFAKPCSKEKSALIDA